MKIILLALLGCALALPRQNDGAGPDLAVRQLDVIRLLIKINEPIRQAFTALKETASSFDPASDGSLFSDGGAAAKRLVEEIRDHRVLKQHHFFSLFNDRHREEALMLFEALMSAKSWNTFISTAAYFRERLNEGVFTYGLYVATIHSELGRGIILPPLYEVTPHLFTNSEVISQAYAAKMRQAPGKFTMAFTGTKKNREQRVAYFGEDIGLNTHHVTWHMDYPFWWKDSYGYKLDRKGELFFWAHHQLTVRFDAERLSNNLNTVDELYWDRPIYEGFAPHTTYKYGGEFPSRPDNVEFEDVDGVARIRDMLIYESRIRDAIAHGYLSSKDGYSIDIRSQKGIELLGDVIESSAYSVNPEYYGALHNLAHIILGRQGDPHGKFAQPPGVMEHFETATRDPAFFRLHKYTDNILKEHKFSLPSYTAKDIEFSGVSVDSISVDGKLETFFEDFEFELLNGVDDAALMKDIQLSAVVSRLNHAPFSYKISVSNSGGARLGTVRIYLCPNKDANGIRYNFENGAWQCIELDKFWSKLTPGQNQITRKSVDSSITVPDVPSFRYIFEKSKAAVKSGSKLNLEAFERSCGIPNRLLLPKGKPAGMEFALFVVVTDGSEDAAVANLDQNKFGSHAQCGIHGEVYPDKKPLGYPFDRYIPDDRIFKNAKNVKWEIVEIKHRS